MKDILPMSPEQGPPLPRKAGVTWPVLWTLITLPVQIAKAITKTKSAIQRGGEVWRFRE